MTVRIACSGCQATLNIPQHILGNPVKCGGCGKVFSTDANGAITPSRGLWSIVRSPLQIQPEPAGAPEEVTEDELMPEVDFDADVDQSTAPAAEPVEATPVEGSASDVEIGFDLDGPGAAAALAEPAKAEATVEGPTLAREPQAAAGLFRLDIAGATSTGKVRKRNEDSFSLLHQTWSNLDERHEAAIVVLADGMGGYEAGDRASNLVIRHVTNALSPLLLEALDPELETAAMPDLKTPILDSIKKVNQIVYQKGLKEQQGKKGGGMGSTAAILAIWDGFVQIGHVGDTRVYHYRAGAVRQVTKDQTLVQRMLDMGTLTEEEAKQSTVNNQVMQAVGRADVKPNDYDLQLEPGDWLVVACDGLHAHVDSTMLTQALSSTSPSAGLLSHYLVDLTNHLGGTDNVTVVAIRCY